MEYTKGECGCYVVISPDKTGYGIVYCPLHKAAPDMYEALEESYHYINRVEANITSECSDQREGNSFIIYWTNA